MKASRGKFLASPVVRTPWFHCGGPESIPGGRTKIPQAEKYEQKGEKKVIECLLSVSPYSVLFKYGSFYPHNNSMI